MKQLLSYFPQLARVVAPFKLSSEEVAARIVDELVADMTASAIYDAVVLDMCGQQSLPKTAVFFFAVVASGNKHFVTGFSG